ncbi:MAG TPA: ABC transporter substrate-binding protein [Candidatus Angelobacter sp.]|nr:ABC transporter substrate-binding protein [Candidatus Angelobacter sp.]
MKRLLLRLSAISSLLLLAAGAYASSRPRYGGAVHVLLHDRVMSIDPLSEDDHPAARDRMASLAFETLTAIDSEGRVQPKLASSWRSDQLKRSWQFRLRLASFFDGTVLTAADVAASLARSNSAWKYSAPDRQTVVIDTPAPVQHMPEMLALMRYAIIKRQVDNTGTVTLLGTGPYKLSQWRAGDRAQFSVNDDYWGGRAFPDTIEFQMGMSLREQLLDRQLAPNSAAEIGIDQIRALEQTSQYVALSKPSDLLAVVFLQSDSPSRSGRNPVDARVREALSLTINRTAINNVLLQHRGTPASGLLPQWLTGYEFMFPASTDLQCARDIRTDAAAYVVITPIMLAYDSADPLLKLVAERIAVDAREAGIVVQPYAESHVNSRAARASINADAVLLRLPMQSVEASIALAARADDLGLGDSVPAILAATRPEDLFEDERKLLENHRVIPIAHLPQALWLNNTVHNWQQFATGEWQLDQLWVEGAH